MDDAASARAARRERTWQATISRGGEHRPVGLLAPDHGLAVMWELAVSAWTVSGRPLPTYTRAEMPGRLVVAGRPR